MTDLDAKTIEDEIYELVLTVIDADGFGTWHSTPIPALGNCTPFHMMMNGKPQELLDYVNTYQDPSFS